MTPLKKQGRPDKYEQGFKLAVVKEYFSSNLGYGALAKKYGLANADTVKGFVRWYEKKYGPELIEPPAIESVDKQQSLGEDLREAHLKVTALELLIKNASKELGVDLVKKFGTKQPKK